MPWLDDLITLATTAGAGTLDYDLFISTGATPPILTSGTAVFTETSGSGLERTQNAISVPGYIHVAAQIMVRAQSWELAKLKAMKLWQAFVPVRNQFINSGFYREINPLGTLHDLGVDDRRQVQCAFNVAAVKRPEIVL